MKFSTQRYGQDLRRYYRLPATQVSLTIVLSFFVISIFIIFALRPTIISITTLKKTITESQATLKLLDAKVVNLQKASQQLDTVRPLLSILNTNIPNKGAMYAPLSSAVESIAASTATQVESETLGPTLLFSRLLTPFTPNKNQTVIELPFSVRIVGSYPGVVDFLTRLLSMERIISIESVSITKEASAKSEALAVGLSVSGSAYYLADETQLDKALNQPKGAK